MTSQKDIKLVSAVKISYLLTLLQLDGEKCSLSKFAQIHGVSKSTVSRTMSYFEECGIVEKDSLVLTVYGKVLALAYSLF